MNASTFHGHWWLPDIEPLTSQPGVLSITENGEVTLELIGGFDLSFRTRTAGGAAIGISEKPMAVIHGESEGKRITLLDCFSLLTRGAWFAGTPNFHRIRAQRALVGAHISAEDSPVVKAAYLRFENLTAWAGLPVVGRAGDWQNGEMSATLKQVESVDTLVDGWTYSLRSSTTGFRSTQTRESHELAGDTTTVLKITPPNAATLEAFDSPILEVMDLLTLASNEACGLISAWFELVTVDVIPERDGRPPIERPIMVESLGRRVHTANPTAPATKIQEFTFTCRDLAFPDVLARWIPLRRRASEAANVYFGLKYSNPGFTETRLLLDAVAAEALHESLCGDAPELDAKVFADRRTRLLAAMQTEDERKWVKQKLRNDPSFRVRMTALAGIPEAEAVERIIPDVPRWADELVKARNGLAHTAGRDVGVGLLELEDCTSALLTLVLLAEIGLSPEVQQRAAEGPLQRLK